MKITDEGVTRLDLHAGRTQLLEEIMAATETTDHVTPMQRRTHRRWVPALVAAAVVAAIVTVPLWLGNDASTAPDSPDVAGGPAEFAVLEADGWTLRYADGELSYERDDRNVDPTPGNDGDVVLDIHWRPAEQYESYVADRERITRTPRAGEPIVLLGAPARMWAYSADDHTVIREVVGEHTLEVRGSGLSEGAFRELLQHLRGVDREGLREHSADVVPAPAEVQMPPKPLLFPLDEWMPVVDNGEVVGWRDPSAAENSRRIHLAWVGGVDDVFAYDRYQGLPREEIRLLGVRTLVTEFEEDGEQYYVVATSPVADDGTILVLEATDMDKESFLAAVREQARWVSSEEYERAIEPYVTDSAGPSSGAPSGAAPSPES